MKSFVKNLLEILKQGLLHGLRAVFGRWGEVSRLRLSDTLGHLDAAEGTAVQTPPETPAAGRYFFAISLFRQQRILVSSLLLFVTLAVTWASWPLYDHTAPDEAPAVESWISRYQSVNEIALSTGITPSLDVLRAGAAENPLRKQLLYHLIGRQTFDQTLEPVVPSVSLAENFDWAEQDPDTVQAYAEAMLESLEQLQFSGQYDSAIALGKELLRRQEVFSGSQPLRRDLALKLAIGRVELAAGRLPTESWIESINEWMESAPKDLTSRLGVDATMFLAQRDLMFGKYRAAREKLATAAVVLDQVLPDAHESQVDLLQMRLASLSLQAGSFKAPLKRLEPMITKAAEPARCHFYLEGLLTWADIAVQQAQYVRAELAYQQAQACLASKGSKLHFQQGRLQNSLGVLLTQLGRSEEARAALKIAEGIWTQTLPAHHAWRGSLNNNLGAWHRSQGDFDSAKFNYEVSAEIWREGLGGRHPVMATYFNNVAELDMLSSRMERVNASLLLSLDLRREAFGEEHPWTALVVSNLGEYLALVGQSEKAFGQHEKALKVRELTLGKAHPDSAMSLNNMGSILYGNQEFRLSLEKFGQALAINKAALGEQHPRTLLSMTHLAANHMVLGDFEEAEALLLKVVSSVDILERRTILLHSALVKLGEAQLLLGKPMQAETQYLSALELADKGGRKTMQTGSNVAYRALIEIYGQRKDPNAARQLKRKYPWVRALG